MKSKLLEKSSKAVSKILLAAQNFTRQLYFTVHTGLLPKPEARSIPQLLPWLAGNVSGGK
jgi:hypothetical protein